MRKTTIAAITLALIAAPVGAQSFSASAMKAERDRAEAGEGVRFMDAVPTWGHAARKKTNEDLYRQQVNEAQNARRYGQAVQMDRDMDRARAMADESRARLHDHIEQRLDRSRERLERLSNRPPPRRPPPRPPRPAP
jgi:hypothetical protein